MKLKKLLKFVFVSLALITFFKLQYYAKMQADAVENGYSLTSSHPFSSLPDNSNFPLPYNSDLLRLEIFLLFLFLLVHFAFSLNIYQFPSVKIWIPLKIPLQPCNLTRIKDRAPPFNL